MAHSNHSILWYCHIINVYLELYLQLFKNTPMFESRLFSLHLFWCLNMQKKMVRMNYGFIILNHSSQRLKVTAVYVAAEYDLIVGCHIDNFLDIPLYSFTLCFYCLMTP